MRPNFVIALLLGSTLYATCATQGAAMEQQASAQASLEQDELEVIPSKPSRDYSNVYKAYEGLPAEADYNQMNPEQRMKLAEDLTVKVLGAYKGMRKTEGEVFVGPYSLKITPGKGIDSDQGEWNELHDLIMHEFYKPYIAETEGELLKEGLNAEYVMRRQKVEESLIKQIIKRTAEKNILIQQAENGAAGVQKALASHIERSTEVLQMYQSLLPEIIIDMYEANQFITYAQAAIKQTQQTIEFTKPSVDEKNSHIQEEYEKSKYTLEANQKIFQNQILTIESLFNALYPSKKPSPTTGGFFAGLFNKPPQTPESQQRYAVTRELNLAAELTYLFKQEPTETEKQFYHAIQQILGSDSIKYQKAVAGGRLILTSK